MRVAPNLIWTCVLLFRVFSPQVAVQEDSYRGWQRAGPDCSLHQSGFFRWICEGEWQLKWNFSTLRGLVAGPTRSGSPRDKWSPSGFEAARRWPCASFAVSVARVFLLCGGFESERVRSAPESRRGFERATRKISGHGWPSISPASEEHRAGAGARLGLSPTRSKPPEGSLKFSP